MEIVYILLVILMAVGGTFFRSFFAEAGKDAWGWVKSKFDSSQPISTQQSETYAQEGSLREQYVSAATNAWKKEGTAEHYLNGLDIPNKEKAEIFKAACLRHKKREPKRNPFEK